MPTFARHRLYNGDSFWADVFSKNAGSPTGYRLLLTFSLLRPFSFIWPIDIRNSTLSRLYIYGSNMSCKTPVTMSVSVAIKWTNHCFPVFWSMEGYHIQSVLALSFLSVWSQMLSRNLWKIVLPRGYLYIPFRWFDG